MRDLTNAPMLCRVLVGLDRAAALCAFRLEADGRAAVLSLERGAIVSANVDRRVATSPRQLFESVRRACDWSGLELRVEDRPPAAACWMLREPVPARSLALQLLRDAAQRADLARVRLDLGAGKYRLTDAGEALLTGGALRPEESAAAFWLRRGVSAEEIPTLPGCGLPGYRFVWMLKLAGAAAPRRGGSYPLLLRKRREIRDQAPPRALLDLPRDASGGDARRALRKLVRDLHPDRFGEAAPPALRRASGEIVSALVTAEAAIRTDATD